MTCFDFELNWIKNGIVGVLQYIWLYLSLIQYLTLTGHISPVTRIRGLTFAALAAQSTTNVEFKSSLNDEFETKDPDRTETGNWITLQKIGLNLTGTICNETACICTMTLFRYNIWPLNSYMLQVLMWRSLCIIPTSLSQNMPPVKWIKWDFFIYFYECFVQLYLQMKVVKLVYIRMTEGGWLGQSSV